MRLRPKGPTDQVSLNAGQHSSNKDNETRPKRCAADDQRGLHATFLQKAYGERAFKFHHEALSCLFPTVRSRGRTRVPGVIAVVTMTCSPAWMPWRISIVVPALSPTATG